MTGIQESGVIQRRRAKALGHAFPYFQNLRSWHRRSARILLSPVSCLLFHSQSRKKAPVGGRKSEVGSAGSLAKDDDREGTEEDFEVEEQRPVVDVIQIKLHPLVEIDLITS